MSPQAEGVPQRLDDAGERGRVAGVAGEDPDRDRPPGRVGQQPVLDLQFSFLAVPGVAAGGQRALRAFQPRGGQVEQRHLCRVDLRGQVAAGQFGLDAVLPGCQPVHRCVDVIGGGARDAQVAAEGDIGPPGQGGQLGARLDHPGDDQRQGQVPLAACRAQQRGQPEPGGHRVHRGDVPVRHGPGDGDRLPGRDQPLAFQGRLDRGGCLGRQCRQVGQRLMPDLAAVPVGPADQDRLIDPPLAGLRHVGAFVPGYVHCAAACHHTLIIGGSYRRKRDRHTYFVATSDRRIR